MASPGAPAASWARPKARSASAVPYGERAARLISKRLPRRPERLLAPAVGSVA
jgi:hypothetical protein